ncbi:MAG: D-alanyl-D-alanine carboxypeptidase family protein [Alphaproteobacteria bacterium]
MKKILSLCIVLYGIAIFPAIAMETAAKQAFMMDADTGTVLLNKSGDEQMHPSSMSKLMTTYIAFKRLKEGRMKLTDTLTVSEKAWKMQGSKTFVHVGDSVPVEELLYGIIIQSGNDACIVIAEGISGSEEAFAAEMNKVAKEIGMNNSNFVNATGWPDDGHLMTARDLAILAKHLINDFPEYYHYFAVPEHTYNKIRQYNRNLLLGGDLGVDGLKTGHTEVAGYGITLSAKKDGRRLILVVNGLESEKQRKEEGDRLLRYGFREFTNKKLVSKGQNVADATVWFGERERVGLIADADIVATVPHAKMPDMKFTLKYNSPVPAPIAKGTHIADLVITQQGGAEQTVPLLAAEDVEKLSGFGRIKAFFKHSLMGGTPES